MSGGRQKARPKQWLDVTTTDGAQTVREEREERNRLRAEEGGSVRKCMDVFFSVLENPGETPPRAEVWAGETYVYRFYARDGELLYVGVAANPVTRMRSHQKDKPWFGQVISGGAVRFELYETRLEALAEESRAIVEERPAHNIMGKPSDDFEPVTCDALLLSDGGLE